MPHVLPSFLPSFVTCFLPSFLPSWLSVLAHVTRDFVTILRRVPRMRTAFINRMRLYQTRRVAHCGRFPNGAHKMTFVFNDSARYHGTFIPRYFYSTHRPHVGITFVNGPAEISRWSKLHCVSHARVAWSHFTHESSFNGPFFSLLFPYSDALRLGMEYAAVIAQVIPLWWKSQFHVFPNSATCLLLINSAVLLRLKLDVPNNLAFLYFALWHENLRVFAADDFIVTICRNVEVGEWSEDTVGPFKINKIWMEC